MQSDYIIHNWTFDWGLKVKPFQVIDHTLTLQVQFQNTHNIIITVIN